MTAPADAGMIKEQKVPSKAAVLRRNFETDERMRYVGKKENFGQAMYEMFGVGKQPEQEIAAAVEEAPVKTTEETPAKQPVAPQPVAEPKTVVQPKPKAVTYLAPGTAIQGTLTTDGDVEVAGKFQGDIVAEGNVKLHDDICGNVTASQLEIDSCELVGDVEITGLLVVDEGSRLCGSVKAKRLQCAGRIEGNITVEENAEFSTRAQVKGDIRTKTMTMACGARIDGKVEMGG